MFAPFAPEKGWHYNATYNLYQKVKGRVFVYVSRQMFGSFTVQLYLRGSINMGHCQLEAETSNNKNLELMFEMGEQWLLNYNHGDLSKIHEDLFSIINPDGVWKKDRHLKKFRIND